MISPHPRRVAIGQWPRSHKYLAASPSVPHCSWLLPSRGLVWPIARREDGKTLTLAESTVWRGGEVLLLSTISRIPRFRSSSGRGFGREPYCWRVMAGHRLLCSQRAALRPPSTLSAIVSSGSESTPRGPAGAHQYGRKPPVSFWPTFARGLTSPVWGGFILRVSSSQ
ncbi:hypothetical protein AB1N83_013275 [Pleurotus pulmonarius]